MEANPTGPRNRRPVLGEQAAISIRIECVLLIASVPGFACTTCLAWKPYRRLTRNDAWWDCLARKPLSECVGSAIRGMVIRKQTSLVVPGSVVALRKPMTGANCDKLLVKAAIASFESQLPIASQILKMEPNRPRMVEVGCEVMRGLDTSATAMEHRVSNIGW